MGLYEKVKELSRYGEVVSGDRKEKYLVKQIKAQFEPHFDEIKIYPTEVLSWSNKELEIECEGGKVPKSDIVTLPYSPSADLETENYKIISLNNLTELNVKYGLLGNEGKVLIFTLNDDTLRKVVLKNRILLQNSPQPPPYTPAFFVTQNALKFLKGKCRFYTENIFKNSIGYSIEGISNRKNDEKIYVTAHHDHWFYGEHDDLVGVALLTELMNEKYDNEIHAISFTAEESGCYFESFSWACGSKAFVENNAKRLEGTKFVLSLDNIADSLYVYYTPVLSIPLSNNITNVSYPSPYTDSYRFLSAGIPTISFHSINYKYYHSSHDILTEEEAKMIEENIIPLIVNTLRNTRLTSLEVFMNYIKNQVIELPVEIKTLITNIEGKRFDYNTILPLYKSILYSNGKIMTTIFHTLKGIKESYFDIYVALEDFGEIEHKEGSNEVNYFTYLNRLYREETKKFYALLSDIF